MFHLEPGDTLRRALLAVEKLLQRPRSRWWYSSPTAGIGPDLLHRGRLGLAPRTLLAAVFLVFRHHLVEKILQGPRSRSVVRQPDRCLLDNDIPGLDESGLTREAATPSGETFGNLGTGLQNPDQSISRATTSTCIGQLLIGMKELCRDSGWDETVTAEMAGQVARDLSDENGGDFPI